MQKVNILQFFVYMTTQKGFLESDQKNFYKRCMVMMYCIFLFLKIQKIEELGSAINLAEIEN